ncbi:hypothetical protein AKJ16_DCAP25993, partial [Drosera capensis]
EINLRGFVPPRRDRLSYIYIEVERTKEGGQRRCKCCSAWMISPLSQHTRFSKEKTENLGINYIPLKESLRGKVESLKEKGLLNFRYLITLLLNLGSSELL